MMKSWKISYSEIKSFEWKGLYSRIKGSPFFSEDFVGDDMICVDFLTEFVLFCNELNGWIFCQIN